MADRSGKQLGNYHLLRPLGKGGFAEVYLGEHIYLKTPVAVKLLHTQLENEDMTGFLNEAQMIARLQHAHIVRVTDFGMDGDLPYLVMDFAPNGTLRERHPRGSVLPIGTVSSYVKQVAEALQYAHDERLIHRDIKPENMLLARNNSVLLSDFGIATVAHRTATQNTSIIAGTAVYMSPELFRGKSYPASDQYALGVVVYEWLCGQPPFYEGDFIQLGYQHTYVPPEPLSEKSHLISKDVEHIVNIALAKDPKQRFGSVQAFANAFEQASQSKQGNVPPIRPTPLPTPTPTPTPPIAVATEEYKPPVEAVSLTSTDGLAEGVTSNDVVQPKPVTEVPVKKSNILWRIGRRQVVAMIVGVIFYVGLSTLTLSFGQSDASHALIFPAVLSTLYFGSVYGPWVGAFTGGVGSLIGIFVPFYIDWYSYGFIRYWSLGFMRLYYDFLPGALLLPWGSWVLANLVIGFIVGIAFIKLRGRYDSVRNIVIVDVLSACTLLIILSIALRIFSNSSRFVDLRSLNSVLFSLPNVVIGLIVLPILLILYNKVVKRASEA